MCFLILGIILIIIAIIACIKFRDWGFKPISTLFIFGFGFIFGVLISIPSSKPNLDDEYEEISTRLECYDDMSYYDKIETVYLIDKYNETIENYSNTNLFVYYIIYVDHSDLDYDYIETPSI